jgi:hypothetical protein
MSAGSHITRHLQRTLLALALAGSAFTAAAAEPQGAKLFGSAATSATRPRRSPSARRSRRSRPGTRRGAK